MLFFLSLSFFCIISCLGLWFFSSLLNLCLIRSALLFWIVPHTRSIQSVAAAYPVTWGLTALGMCVYYCSENGLISKRKRQN